MIGETVPLSYWHRSFTLFGALCGALLLCMLNGEGVARRMFAWAPLRIFGVVSFSAYLWHPTVMALVHAMPGLHPLVRSMLLLGLVLMASTISYLLIERPFLRIALRDPVPCAEPAATSVTGSVVSSS